MAKTASKRHATEYRCAECGWNSVKWVGRCGDCQAWGSVVEQGAALRAATAAAVARRAALPLSQVHARAATATPSGVAELDRVLGGDWCRVLWCCWPESRV